MRRVLALPGFFIGLLLTIVACSTLNLAPAQNFDQKLAYAYGTHTAILQTAASAVRSGTITQADGRTVLDLADKSRTLLDSAKSLEGTDLKTATGQFALASAILTNLQTYLNQRLTGKTP
jgi:hypothetical protein